MIYYMYSIAKNIQIVIASLKAHNIRYLVLNPGGTNAPFIRNVQDDTFFTCYSIVDERSALYFAIGIYLATGEPVAVCCTSAQATRNFIPGLTEAFYKHVPILAITFSKHYRFVGQDYMQAPNQISLPVDSVKKSYALPYVSNEHDYKHCVRLANEAMMDLNHKVPAPIQLNIPMLDTELGQDTEEILPQIKVIKRYYLEDVKNLNLANRKVLIVVGENQSIDDTSIIRFAERTNTVIYVNQLSNMRNDYTVEGNLLLTVISQKDFDDKYSPDILITIGGQTGDYPLYHKLAEGEKCFEHWRISPVGDVVDTYDRLTKVFECNIEDFFDNISCQNSDHSYLNFWKESILNYNIDIDIPLSNAYVAQKLHNLIPEGSYVNFAILNSLRVWNLFHIKNKVKCFSNVGAFGIDGGLSTLIGQSVVTNNLCYMVIGDLSFLYDMNSLGIRHIRNNLRVILINNQGGIEFKYGGTAERRKSIDRYIAAAGHFKNAKGWTETNGLTYYPVTNTDDLNRIIPLLVVDSEKSILIEVFTTDQNESDAMFAILEANRYKSFGSQLSSRIKSGLKRFF